MRPDPVTHTPRPTASRTKRIAASIALILAVTTAMPTAFAAAEHDLEPLRIPHQKFVLDNGLTLIVHEDSTVPIVAVNVWYHVGSRFEQRGKTGFAHLFEHFFFNGSENHPHGFREAMDDIGANNRNGTTNADRTNFFEDVPTSGLERTLYLEADRMGFLAGNLSEEMLERERGVVQNEKRQGENRPYGRVFGRIVESIYPYSHPYSWSTIGKMEDLNAASIEDIRAWYEAYYGPNNCVLSLAGDITAERALELVKKYFGSIPPGPPIPRHRAWVPSLERNRRDEMQDRVPQTRIYRVYHAPPWSSPDIQDLELAAGVLSGSRSSRLDRRLVYDKQLATDVSASVWDREIASSFLVIVTVKPGVDPDEAEREMDAVVAEYLENGPTEAELERARTRTVSRFIRGMERLGGFGGRSDILAANQTYGGDPAAYLDRLKIRMDATPERVVETSRRWLRAHHYTLQVKPFPDLDAGESTVDRSILPPIGDAPDVGFPRVQETTLSNGLRVLLLERQGAPIVNMTLALDAGYASDPASGAGTARLALQLMEEGGTASRDGFGIVDELDAMGASISTGNSLDLSYVRLRALGMNLAGSVEIFSDVVRNPAFPAEMVEIGKRRQLARIEQEVAQPRTNVYRLAPRLLYGEGHAYSNPLTGTGYPETVESLDREDLAAWHGSWFHPNRATLIVAGAVKMDALQPILARTFGSWKKGRAPEKRIAAGKPPASGRVYLVDKPGAPQSVIVATHLSRPGGQPEDLAMETVMRLFGGMSTSRLNRNLRLDKHWSYGVSGRLIDARGQRPFLVVAPVQTDKTRESMIEVRDEIRGIAGQRPIEGEEFASIRRNMLLRLPGRFETLSSLEGAAGDLVYYGYAPEYYYDYAANVRRLGANELNAAAAKFVNPAALTWIVVGDLASIESGIRELKFGEIVRLRSDGNPVESAEGTQSPFVAQAARD